MTHHRFMGYDEGRLFCRGLASTRPQDKSLANTEWQSQSWTSDLPVLWTTRCRSLAMKGLKNGCRPAQTLDYRDTALEQIVGQVMSIATV